MDTSQFNTAMDTETNAVGRPKGVNKRRMLGLSLPFLGGSLFLLYDYRRHDVAHAIGDCVIFFVFLPLLSLLHKHETVPSQVPGSSDVGDDARSRR